MMSFLEGRSLHLEETTLLDLYNKLHMGEQLGEATAAP